MCQLSKKAAFLLISCDPTDPKVQDEYNLVVKTKGDPGLHYMEHTATMYSSMSAIGWLVNGTSLIAMPDETSATNVIHLVDKHTLLVVVRIVFHHFRRLQLKVYSLHPDIRYYYNDVGDLMASIGKVVFRR